MAPAQTDFAVGDSIGLTDAAGRNLGTVRVEEVTALWVSGAFTPGPDFPAVELLFREFEELVDGQAISLLDEPMDAIAALGIRAADGLALAGIQIYPVARGANWRPPGYAG